MSDFTPGDKVKRKPELSSSGDAGFYGETLTVREVNLSSGQLRFEGYDGAFAGMDYELVRPRKSQAEWRVREDTDYYAKFDWVVYRGGLYDDPSSDSKYETLAGFHEKSKAEAYARVMNYSDTLVADSDERNG